jgi:uncharacterized protein YecE (DUF72 family)
MIWVGTSGFQYPEWKGKFYPKDLSTAKMLPYYSDRFKTTEINYSFYRIPTVKTLTGWSASTPASFQFSFKAPKQITHIQQLRKTEGIVQSFHQALATLEGKLGMVLFQLPPFLKKDLPLLENFIGALPAGANCAFEFRHDSWFDDSTFAALKSGGCSLCIADTEKLSTPVVFTGKHAYFRLRREDYTKKDIARWAAIIGEETSRMKQIYVYFKHEETGTGPKFARELMDRLGLVEE